MTLANKKSSNEINAHLENEIKKSIQGEVRFDDVSVSYTHLTLPTKA